MIQGPNYVYLQIPHADRDFEFESILLKECDGTALTPKYSTPVVNELDGFEIFTVVTKPFQRVLNMGYRSDGTLEDWFKFLNREGDYLPITPQWYWSDLASTVLRWEQPESVVDFMGQIGYNIEFSPKPTKEKIEEEDAEFIKKHYRKDFLQHGYTMDRRSTL